MLTTALLSQIPKSLMISHWETENLLASNTTIQCSSSNFHTATNSTRGCYVASAASADRLPNILNDAWAFSETGAVAVVLMSNITIPAASWPQRHLQVRQPVFLHAHPAKLTSLNANAQLDSVLLQPGGKLMFVGLEVVNMATVPLHPMFPAGTMPWNLWFISSPKT